MKYMSAACVTRQSIPGGWAERELTLGDRRLRILLPAQPDEFLESLESTGSAPQQLDPYWAELWPASLRMARLVHSSNWPRHTRAVELGCGIGVVGLAGLLAGLDVTFTDHVELAVATALENAQRGGFADAQGFLFDWADPPPLRYSVMLASDVLYDRQLHMPLLRTIQRMLDGGGQCWIGEPGRSAAEAFLEQAARSDLSMRLLDEAGCDVNGFQLGEFRLIVLRHT